MTTKNIYLVGLMVTSIVLMVFAMYAIVPAQKVNAGWITSDLIGDDCPFCDDVLGIDPPEDNNSHNTAVPTATVAVASDPCSANSILKTVSVRTVDGREHQDTVITPVNWASARITQTLSDNLIKVYQDSNLIYAEPAPVCGQEGNHNTTVNIPLTFTNNQPFTLTTTAECPCGCGRANASVLYEYTYCVNPPLAVSCSASPNSTSTGNPVVFTANATGGSGTYSYSWSGDCLGSSLNCSNTYSSQGTKSATVIVTSGGKTASASCSATVVPQPVVATCSSNSDCGTSGATGSLFCQGNNVYQNYVAYTCNNPGTSSSFCTSSSSQQLQNTCSGNQICSGGSCTNSCTSNYQQRCSGNNLYWYDSCGNQQNLIQSCQNGCSGNTCQNYNNYNACTYHSSQRCSGNNLYWYDSCGTQQELAQYCQYGCYNNNCQNYQNTNAVLNVTKTVKNLTTGSGFTNSVYANPSDMLMFMITIQNTSNQGATNVMVKDTLPASITYNNQLVVSGSSNYNWNNYNGNVISGITLGTILANQTATVTYQAQVGPAQNFSYGNTTLNNSAYITSFNAGNPVVGSSIIITKAGVLGATTISTGLTNNFWLDSFFLPLIITLVVIWMWKSGMFFGIEKWLDNKKKTRKGYKSEKELLNKIAKLKNQ